MNLRTILFAALAVVATACASSHRPHRQEPAPYRPDPYRTDLPTQPAQPQPTYPAPVVQTPPPVYAQSTPIRSGDVVLEIRGMNCPVKCVREIKEMLAAAPGVTNVRVDYDARAAIVSVEPGVDPNSLPRYVRPPYSAHVVTAVVTR